MKEKDLEDYLFENPSSIKLFSFELMEPVTITRWIYRQIELPSGIADLIGLTNDGHIAVVELKRDRIKPDAITQVCRYAQDVQDAINLYQCQNESTVQVKRIVIGASIRHNELVSARSTNVWCATFTGCNPFEIHPILTDQSNDETLDKFGMVESLSTNDEFIAAIDEAQIYIDNQKSEYKEFLSRIRQQPSKAKQVVISNYFGAAKL